MEFIYVISHKRGAGDAEIYSLWNNYAGAICAFYDCNVEIEKWLRKENFAFEKVELSPFVDLYKFPANTIFGVTGSDIKMQRSSKYRVKFKDFQELKKEYNLKKLNERKNETL